jgi:anaerobic magnesium-protoporphyrin IX monomethyl ester cyclase
MKVVLIAPPIMDFISSDDELRPIAMDAVRECPPYGIYLLQAVLRAAGHDVVVADMISVGTSMIERWTADIADCGLIGIGATSMSWPTVEHVGRQVRRLRSDVPIVLGGIHPTMFDKYVLSKEGYQFVIRGEGELALPALCRALETGSDFSTVPNLTWKAKDGSIVRNAIGPKIDKDELGRFPVPDYSSLPEGAYKGLAIESSRGCAFDCSFCSTSYRKSWRGIQPELFIDRVASIMNHLQRTCFKTVHIIDDEFSMNPKRAIQIVEVLRRRGLSPRLVYDSRATDLLFPGYAESIAEYTHQFLIGAECGYDDGLARIGKGTTCEILEGAAKKLNQLGIADRSDFSFVLGFPWECQADVKRTIAFAMHLYATYGVRILLQWYCQIPGSRLWEEDRARGLVNEAMYDEFGFFRNLYLFRSGVKLTPNEIYEIADIVGQLRGLSFMRDRRSMIEHSMPAPIATAFPRDLLDERTTGLSSLREVARPSLVKVGVPLRHVLPA